MNIDLMQIVKACVYMLMNNVTERKNDWVGELGVKSVDCNVADYWYLLINRSQMPNKCIKYGSNWLGIYQLETREWRITGHISI